MITARLEATGLEALELNPFNGYAIEALDLGEAQTRAVTFDAPDADGTIDTTQFVGARAVTLSLKLVPKYATMQAMRTRLRAFTHPRLRPVLYFKLDDEQEQRVVLRRSNWSNVIQQVGYAPVIVQWIAPFGVIESAELHDVTVNAVGGDTEGGRVYDRVGDRVYAAGEILGVAEVTNDGNADVYPLLRVYGPCTDPSIENVTQDRALVFTGLTIAAGHYVEIDTRLKTIYQDGVSTNSQYDKLSFPAAEWWTLSPGVNLIRLNPATFATPCQVVLEYRDAWL